MKLARENRWSVNRFASKSFTYFWVRPGFETGPVSFSLDRLIDYEHWLKEFWEYLHTLTPETATESINNFCQSCGRKFQCKAFRKLISEGMQATELFTEEQVKNLSDEDVMAMHHRVHTQLKLIENNKKVLAAYLLKKMSSNNTACIKGEAYKATVRQNRSDSYDTGTVISLCSVNRIDLATVVNVTKKRVEEVFGSRPDAMRMLKLQQRRGAHSPFVDIRVLSKKDIKEQERESQK